MAQGLAATRPPANAASCDGLVAALWMQRQSAGWSTLSLCVKPYTHAAHAAPVRADITVSSGTVDVAVAYRGLPIYTEEKDLCDRTKCPVQPGPLSLKYEQYLPPIAPPVSAAALHALCAAVTACLTWPAP